MKVFKKVLNVIIDILIVIVLITSVFVAVSALTTKAQGMPSIFGFTFQSIQSDSMKGGSDEYPGGDFEKGDLIISRTTGYNPDAKYEIGDIVVYQGRLEGAEEVGDQFICHRIVGTETKDSAFFYLLQGDNPEATKKDEVVPSSIAAKFYTKDYQGKVLKGWGSAYDFITSQTGFFLCILLPMIIFFLYALIRVVISTMNYKKNKSEEEKEEAEKEKQEAVDAAVAAALAAQNSTASASPAETPAEMTPEQMEQFKQFLAFQEAQKAQQAEQTAPETPAEDKASLD